MVLFTLASRSKPTQMPKNHYRPWTLNAPCSTKLKSGPTGFKAFLLMIVRQHGVQPAWKRRAGALRALP